ncbi:B12-binding domain-containing radical SAM protein [bacterium]|nr:B12-binding domain-containing radical SAM protein [bacterium]
MKKLLLINPVNPARSSLTVNKSSRFPPIGLGIVAALTPPGWEIALADENWQSFAYREADCVGITAFTASANRAYEIASLYRQRGVPVILGGIHASMRPEEASRFADAVVIGEAEAVWRKVLEDVEERRLSRRYEGGWSDLSGAPAPRRDLFHPDYLFASVQTSRGCPMDCEFCSVTAFNGRHYRRRPVEAVLAELETIPQKMIFFVDDNIIGYGRESRNQALALFKGMAERRLNKWWFCQASLNFGDDEEVLHWAGRAGCKMVFLGLEAEEIGALQEVNKQLNARRGTAAYEPAFRRIHKAGIAVLGAFIFGIDGDTEEKLGKRARYLARNNRIDVMQTTFLTPLPGTRLFDRYQRSERLLYTGFPKDWEHYDMTEAVHRPAGMDPGQLMNRMDQLNQRIYAWPVLLRKAFFTLLHTRDMTATMFAWNSNINYRNVGRNILRAKKAGTEPR